MGWLCLTARNFALQTGTGEAMIYRLFMFIFVFFISDTGCVVCTIQTLTYHNSLRGFELASQTWPGAAILPFQTEQLFRYLLFLLVRSP